MIGLQAVMLVIGYEWFILGLVKFVRGGFPAGLAEELVEKSEGTAAWYRAFLESAVVPNAELSGYAIETSEFLAGIVLLAGPSSDSSPAIASPTVLGAPCSSSSHSRRSAGRSWPYRTTARGQEAELPPSQAAQAQPRRSP